MAKEPNNFANHPDVMISSTYSDLVNHRRAVADALLRLGFFPKGMELDSAKATKTVVDSSLDMLSNAQAYIGIVSHRYGGVPKDLERNPDRLSITELEYREAIKLGIPVYMFLMSDNHAIRAAEVETSTASRRKLKRLKTDAKARSICAEFSSVEELKSLVLQSMAEFKERIASSTKTQETKSTQIDESSGSDFPTPPNFVAIPPFVSGHDFVGRRAEFEWLDSWVVGNDPVMLIEAIGGVGKSTLVWEWLKERSRIVQPDLAGILWYSFYERGANMDSFAAQTLAYVTEKPLSEFNALKPFDLSRQLMKELRERAFLIVLDGLERVLVAYQRFDPSQTRDDEVSSSIDSRACIKPSDEYLLRELVSSQPSKIVVTSRLIPTAFNDKTHRQLTGVQQRYLAGLQPDDAVRMIRGTGVRGDDQTIKRYLKENFDNHPLMVGIVAGLVNDYIHDPGNFDRWVDDPQGGAVFELSKQTISQRSAHILASALRGLDPEVRQLLSRMAALGGAVSFDTVNALNPFASLRATSKDKRVGDGKEIDDSAKLRGHLPMLVSALQQLEERGLLQWDRKKNRYDLHPVVRGYALDMLEKPERVEISNQIADHFQSKPSQRYENAKTLEDVEQSIGLFRALVQAGRLDEAAGFIMGDFSQALIFSIEAFHEILTLLSPFFPRGFQEQPVPLNPTYAETYLMNSAAIALRKLNRFSIAREAYTLNLTRDLKGRDDLEVHSVLVNLGLCCFDDGHIAESFSALGLSHELAQAVRDREAEAITNLHLITLFRRTGRFDDAAAAYEAFRKIRTPTRQYAYRIGDIEAEMCWLRFYQRKLTYDELNGAKVLGLEGSRETTRSLARLEGELALQLGKPNSAIAAFEAAIEMTQRVAMPVNELDGRRAFAMTLVGELDRATEICERLRDATPPPHVELAPAYLQLGDKNKAKYHALQGYRWAWSEGPPFSRHMELMCCRTVLKTLQEPEPKLPAFDPDTSRSLSCEKHVRNFIRTRRLKADKDRSNPLHP